MRLHAGTSGFSFPEWKGPFYPPDLPAERMLAYYAERLPTVEVNNTFYRMPKREVLRGWAEQVGEGFTFALKASRRITHFKKLREVGDDVAYLVATADELGPHLGPILFQLPPFLRRDDGLLRDFLAALPKGTRAALETRHPSWDDEAVDGLLREHGVARVANEDEEVPPRLVPTAPFAYLRLRRPGYDDAALAAWRDRLAAGHWAEAWVFFKHEEAAAGPRLAARFRALTSGEESPR